ncbi:MAG TPA: alpha/beta fold hydrolase [Rhodocyclaceae bacterium]|nr:alpha/beta fold hydrolase [Rhodocyclaceae bacterium]
MTNSLSRSIWFSCYKHNPAARLRLFCFPYGGGNASAFQSWPAFFSGNIEVWGALLPGRGPRLSEKPFNSLRPLIRGLKEGIAPFSEKPFVFFGHSMGALLCLELTRELQACDLTLPSHVFFSGHRPPHIRRMLPSLHTLSDVELIQALKDLNGTPQEILENKEMMELALPVLRSDMEICETYMSNADTKLKCPISVFGGLQDKEAMREQLDEWRAYTDSAFSLQMFPGDHFFLTSARALVTQQIAKKLERIVMEL